MKLLLPATAALSLLLAACGGSSLPDAGAAEAAVRQELAARSGGKLALARFEKLDAVEGEMMGVSMYELDFGGELEFLADGYWMLGGEDAGFEVRASEAWPSKPVTSGEKVEVQGSVEYMGTENGWTLRNVRLEPLD